MYHFQVIDLNINEIIYDNVKPSHICFKMFTDNYVVVEANFSKYNDRGFDIYLSEMNVCNLSYGKIQKYIYEDIIKFQFHSDLKKKIYRIKSPDDESVIKRFQVSVEIVSPTLLLEEEEFHHNKKERILLTKKFTSKYTPPDITFGFDIKTIKHYTEGGCFMLAFELHRYYNLPIYALHIPNPEQIDHYMVKYNNLFLDINGLWRLDQLRGYWLSITPWDVSYTLELDYITDIENEYRNFRKNDWFNYPTIKRDLSVIATQLHLIKVNDNIPNCFDEHGCSIDWDELKK